MTETTQAAVDAAKTAAEPAVAATDAQAKGDDLDSLLAEFQQGTKTEPSPPATEAVTPQPVSEDRVRAIEERFFQEDVSKTVSAVFDGIQLSERTKRGWVDQLARETPSFAQAFLNRHRNPQAWETAQKWAAKQAKSEFSSSIDKGATEDVAAVTAFALRGASTTAPTAEPAPNLGSMSNVELRAYFQKLGISSPV